MSNGVIKKSHLVPRTTGGWILLIYILFCYLMTQWPVLKAVNKAVPFVLGMPFVYAWLTFWYILLVIGAILAAWKVWKP